MKQVIQASFTNSDASLLRFVTARFEIGKTRVFRVELKALTPDSVSGISQEIYDDGSIVEPSRAAESGAVDSDPPTDDAELAIVLDAWPRLSDGTRKQVVALVQAAEVKS